MAREQMKNLTEPMYYVLLSLIKQNHGYGIMQLIGELTEGRVAVGAGTLYALLGRFESEKIILQVAEENRRRIYSLTEKGHEILQEEYERLNKMVSDGRKFMDYSLEKSEPPNDMGAGITMPVTETTLESEPEPIQEKEALPREEKSDPKEEKSDPKEEAPSEKKAPSERERKGDTPDQKNRKGFGGFGKGVLFPV